MKKRMWIIITLVLVALIISLLIWRFWPQSSSDLISIDPSSISGFSSFVMVQRIENGQPYSDVYRIDNTEQQLVEPGDILEILAISRYQQDFRNLLPWRADSVGADKNYDGRTAVLVFSVGNEMDKWVQVQFLSSSIIVVSVGNEDGFRIYHPTNREVLDKLVEYFQTYGIRK